ncbi:sensor histidine kinase [Streptomyces sp. NPDC020707]|uniref:sensor histidine kinase n=1 Tax=Streptomyces sp. NPDC020707 TaxID=3365084 RepID=UPI0037B10775
MRTRVQAALLLFVVIAVAAFAVPLLLFTASDRTQQLVLARSADLDRFAALMDQAAATGDTSAVAAEARRYTELYGEPLVVTDTRRRTVVQTGGMRAADPAVARLLDAALRNQTEHPSGALRPWSRGHRMFAEPAGTGTRVSGAVVLRASVGTAADEITRRWAAVLAGAALVAVACAVLAQAATGWVVSPLRRLDRAVGQLAAGLPPEQTRAGGPPELRQLAIGFNRMARTVTAALEQQRRLVADTSHQMRNPMAALRLRVDALHTHLAPSGERTYTGVTAELDRLETLLDDLLALATAEHRAGELAMTHGPDVHCDAAAVAADRHRLWEPVAARAGARLALTSAAPPLPAACTDRELAQIADILLDNAIKYAGEGAEISLDCASGAGSEPGSRSESGSGSVVLTVTDDGPGLGTDELALATTRFWRAGHQRENRTAGTGLGLAIAEQLLAGRGGRLELTAARPHGLRARAVVPRAAAGRAAGTGGRDERGGAAGIGGRGAPGDPGGTGRRHEPGEAR